MSDMKISKIIILAAVIFVLAAPVFSQTTPEESQISADYEQLKKDYDKLLKDRDNLRAQAKFLIKYKNEIAEAQKTLNAIEQERSQWDMERETLKSANKNLQNQVSLLQTQIENLNITQMQLEQERDNIKKTLSKSKAGYIIIDDLKRQINDKKREGQRLTNTIARLKGKIDRLEDNLAKAEANIDVERNKVSELKRKYSNALRTNKVLEKKLKYLPREYAEVARENKVLIKRTALMHYNLGVFYTKNKEYPRAIAEFEKTIELNPEDASAYFNLGYIYAEYLVDRPKAIENFSKYLKLAKKDDKDIDWVKRYILTWQTWEGKNKSK
jgi:chromosome segregation ATPase